MPSQRTFERPGGRTTTSTQGSADMVQVFGGHGIYGVTFTPTEMKKISLFYGVDPNKSKEVADKSHAEAVEAAKIAIAKPPKYSWEKNTVKIPTEADRQSVEDFLDTGTNLSTLREATTDGLRLMAYLSHLLEFGEDPVTFVHNLCRDAGYDTMPTGFVEPDEGDDYDCDPGDKDGDAESALASAGWGTDEDYGGGGDYDGD